MTIVKYFFSQWRSFKSLLLTFTSGLLDQSRPGACFFSVHLEVIHLLSNTALWTGCFYVAMYLCSNGFIEGYILAVGYVSGKCYLHLQDKTSGRVEKWLEEHGFYQSCLHDKVAWLECACAVGGLFCVFLECVTNSSNAWLKGCRSEGEQSLVLCHVNCESFSITFALHGFRLLWMEHERLRQELLMEQYYRVYWLYR